MHKSLTLRLLRPAKAARSTLLALILAAVIAGPLGIVAPAHAAPNSEPSAALTARGNNIVDTAMKYLHYRYRFGGTSPRTGFDCTGFVYYVMNAAGVPISRSMYAQYASGRRVSTNDLRPGDILFFSNTYKRGLSHAGIYVGGGMFINAANERVGVTMSKLWSSYWASHFTAAVRPN